MVLRGEELLALGVEGGGVLYMRDGLGKECCHGGGGGGGFVVVFWGGAGPKKKGIRLAAGRSDGVEREGGKGKSLGGVDQGLQGGSKRCIGRGKKNKTGGAQRAERGGCNGVRSFFLVKIRLREGEGGVKTLESAWGERLQEEGRSGARRLCWRF